MATQELRPMGIGDILDTTFRLYRQRFLTFLLIALIVYIPFALLAAVFQTSLVSQAAKPAASGPFDAGSRPGMGQRPVPTVPQIDPMAFVLMALAFLAFAIVLLPLCGAAMVHNISASYLGEDLTAGTSYARASPRLLSLLGTQFLVGLTVLVGFLLCFVPGVIFSLWFFVVVPVVVLEGIGGTSAMGRSRALMQGNLGKGFLLALVVLILTAIINWIFSMLLGLVPWPHAVIRAFFEQLFPAVLLPIQTAPYILLYYDLRIRKEAFDLQQLAASLGQTAAT